MKIIDASDLAEEFKPICPHCGTELNEMVRIEDEKGFFQGAHLGYCYACPCCRKILGFADYSS